MFWYKASTILTVEPLFTTINDKHIYCKFALISLLWLVPETRVQLNETLVKILTYGRIHLQRNYIGYVLANQQVGNH